MPDALHSLLKNWYNWPERTSKSTIFNAIMKIANLNEDTTLIDGIDYQNISAKNIIN
jgi:ABC-type multidrug transport system fused ATPase/permease subunit